MLVITSKRLWIEAVRGFCGEGPEFSVCSEAVSLADADARWERARPEVLVLDTSLLADPERQQLSRPCRRSCPRRNRCS